MPLVACRPFHKLPLPKLVATYTGDRGWGVQAIDFIPCGTFVVEYTGELELSLPMALRLSANLA